MSSQLHPQQNHHLTSGEIAVYNWVKKSFPEPIKKQASNRSSPSPSEKENTRTSEKIFPTRIFFDPRDLGRTSTASPPYILHLIEDYWLRIDCGKMASLSRGIHTCIISRDLHTITNMLPLPCVNLFGL